MPCGKLFCCGETVHIAIHPFKMPQVVHAHSGITGNDIAPFVIYRTAGDEEHVVAGFSQPQKIALVQHVGDGGGKGGRLIGHPNIVQEETAVVLD